MKVKRLLQVFCSLILSFVILNGVCFFYYNVPVHSESETGSTDYIWEKGKFYSKGTEGFAFGKTDDNGFNNITAENSISPEILIMGSSHTEAFNVAQNENYAYLLNGLMNETGTEWTTYNIGVSGHTITTCLNNLENAISEFKPTKYVVIEVSSTQMTLNEINQISEGTVKKIHSSANPILVFLQKIPFIRCVYYQIDKMDFGVKNTNNTQIQKADNKKTNGSINSNNDITSDSTKAYEDALDLLLKNVASVAESNNVKLIVFLNSDLQIDKNGEVIPASKSKEAESFENACVKNGIGYLDMYDAYAEMYDETHCLPHGFSNTEVGVGHLNKYGHKAIADELYGYIVNSEKNSGR